MKGTLVCICGSQLMAANSLFVCPKAMDYNYHPKGRMDLAPVAYPDMRLAIVRDCAGHGIKVQQARGGAKRAAEIAHKSMRAGKVAMIVDARMQGKSLKSFRTLKVAMRPAEEVRLGKAPKPGTPKIHKGHRRACWACGDPQDVRAYVKARDKAKKRHVQKDRFGRDYQA